MSDDLLREAAYAARMSELAQYWMARAQNAERRQLQVAAMLVHAAGGSIELGIETMGIAPELELIREENPANLSMVWRTRRASKEKE